MYGDLRQGTKNEEVLFCDGYREKRDEGGGRYCGRFIVAAFGTLVGSKSSFEPVLPKSWLNCTGRRMVPEVLRQQFYVVVLGEDSM